MKTTVYKETKEDWYGNWLIPGPGPDRITRLVCVSTMFLPAWDGKDIPLWRVCVWGNDDMGMEIDLDSPKEAKEIFDIVIGWEYVSKGELILLGFDYA